MSTRLLSFSASVLLSAPLPAGALALALCAAVLDLRANDSACALAKASACSVLMSKGAAGAVIKSIDIRRSVDAVDIKYACAALKCGSSLFFDTRT